MQEKRKQSAVIAVAATLGMLPIISPIAVYAQEEKKEEQAVIQSNTTQIKEKAPAIELPQNLTGKEGQPLQEIALPEHWSWTKEATQISKDKTKYPARITVNDVLYDYSDVEGYNADGHYVECNLTLVVNEQVSVIEYAESEPQATTFNTNIIHKEASTPKSNDIDINDQTFPDQTFREWVIANVAGADDKILTPDEISKITDIDLSNYSDKGKIVTLQGIEYFSELVNLNVYNSAVNATSLESLDVSKNTKLETLDCTGNKNLTTLTVKGASALKELWCSVTGITTLDVSNNTALTTLICSSTGITSLNVSDNKNLTKLYCHSNTNLKSLTIQGAAALEILDCYNTVIDSLDISNNKNLKELDCASNANLKSLKVEGATALERLSCSSTGITSLDVSNNDALKLLDCSYTGINNLDVSNNTALTNLYCFETPLAYLNIGENKGLTVDKSNLINPTVYVATNSFMLTDKFSGIDLTKISNLNGADWNSQTGEVYNIKSGTPITFDYDCGTSINGKETLNVTLTVTNELAIDAINFPDKGFRDWLEQQSYGQDGKITQNEIAGITEINVGGNRNIEDLTGIEHFTALTELLCLYSGISSLDVSKNTQLTYLNCVYTGISELDVSKNTKLTTLSCSNTWITSLDVSKNTQLTYLNCILNAKLAKLTVAGATELTDLYCNKTGISDLDVSKNTKLTYLYCDNTGITSLDVSKNTQLTTLSCDNTGITSLDVSKNTQLTYLDCYETPLAYLNIGANNNLTINKNNLKQVSLEITEDSFNMADKFNGIEIGKISNVSGADYNNGIMSNYDVGTPITYTYACGTSKNGAQTIDVTLNLTGSFITITDDLDKPYDGTAISDTPNVRKSGSTGAVSYMWERKKNATEWEQIATAPSDAGTYRVTATLAPDKNYKGATSEPKEFTISQADSTISVTEELNKIYDKNSVNATPSVSKSGSNGAVSFKWEKKVDDTDWEEITSAPTEVGTYRVTATLASDNNYKSATSAPVEFIISQAPNSWIDHLTIMDWIYGENPSKPIAKASFGDSIFTYSDSKKGTYTDIIPTNAGTWYVKATIADTDNYTGLETTLAFTISPKSVDHIQIVIPDIQSDKDVENLVIMDGDKVLVKNTDYIVDKIQKEEKVDVTITFKGNYTGSITKSYMIKQEEIKEKEKETGNGIVAAGGIAQTGLFTILSILPAGCIAMLKDKKRNKDKN